MHKKCSKCLLDIDVANFYIDAVNGIRPDCKDCVKLRNKIFYSDNRDKIIVKTAQWRNENKQKSRNSSKEWQIHKYRTDNQYKLQRCLRSRLFNAVKNNHKAGSAVRDLGCSIEHLRAYLESKFQPGMTWDNWSSNGWHIDHIIPLSSFDLTDIDQLKKACHYTNLQPLWAKDNLIKGGR